jgi:hypothetical protein
MDDAYNQQKEIVTLANQSYQLTRQMDQDKIANRTNTVKAYEQSSMSSTRSQIDQMAQTGEIDSESARMLKQKTIGMVAETLDKATNGFYGSQNINKIQEMLIKGKTPQEVI